MELTAAVETMAFQSRPSQFTAAFASLDEIDLKENFSSRAALMRSVLFFLRGAFRTTIRVAIAEIVRGIDDRSNVRTSRVEVVPVAPQTSPSSARKRRARAKEDFGGKVSSLPDGSVVRVVGS